MLLPPPVLRCRATPSPQPPRIGSRPIRPNKTIKHLKKWFYKDNHYSTKKGSNRLVESPKVSELKVLVESETVRTRQIRCPPRIMKSKFLYPEIKVEFFLNSDIPVATKRLPVIFLIFFFACGAVYFFCCVRHFITLLPGLSHEQWKAGCGFMSSECGE